MRTITKVLPASHNSFESAYLVESYPYGSLRCKIWFWIEHKPSKGFRFCSRTENPKTGRLNAPKKGPYWVLARVMYLDEQNHVQCAGLSEYSTPQEILEFVRDFHYSSPELLVFCGAKYRLDKAILESGFHLYKINGESLPLSEADKDRLESEKKLWAQAHLALQARKEENQKEAESKLDVEI